MITIQALLRVFLIIFICCAYDKNSFVIMLGELLFHKGQVEKWDNPFTLAKPVGKKRKYEMNSVIKFYH